MEPQKLRAAILVVSDTAAVDPSTDKAIKTLEGAFASGGGDRWTVAESLIVPDDVHQIQETLTSWSDTQDSMNLIVTTGGTGFATKDNTPEAVVPLIHRHAPGLVHGMLASSLNITPFALMSRPVAGVRHQTIILTLPGSPKGAEENLLSVLKLLPHACTQAAGSDSRKAHEGGTKKLEQDANVRSTESSRHSPKHACHHQHHHDHGSHRMPIAHTDPQKRPVSNDPRAGPTARHRSSPYPIITVEEALQLILTNTHKSVTTTVRVNPDLVGHVLATDVQACEAVPAYRASIVDGYAVIIPSVSSFEDDSAFPVVAISHASSGDIPSLKPGQIARITTGAPLPPGANAVVMVEDTVIQTMTPDGREEATVKLLALEKTKAGENIREVGSDIELDQVILEKDSEVTTSGGELGLLASIGKAVVEVYRRPLVGVLSTGDEIISHDRPGRPRLGEVRDCNRPTLLSAIGSWGYRVADLGIAADTPGALEEKLRSALQSVDVIVTSGGVSMGELDLLKPTIERNLGGTIHFGRVGMKPGKPTTFATVPFKDPGTSSHQTEKPVFCLPGNPASALVTAHLFLLPCLQKMQGRKPPYGLPRCRVVLGEDVKCDMQRAEYHRVGISVGDDGRLMAISTGGQRSSKIGSLKGAAGLLCLPAGGMTIRKGNCVDALLMGGLQGL